MLCKYLYRGGRIAVSHSILTLVIGGIAMSPIRAEDSPTWQSNFRKVCDQPLSLIEFLQRSPLVDDLVVGAEGLDLALEKEGFEVEPHASSSRIRVGGKSVDLQETVARQVHFDNAQHRPWIDLVRFSEELAEVSTVERMPKMEGRRMTLLLNRIQ